MGLDWILLDRAKDGHEDEVARIRDQLGRDDIDEADQDRLADRLGELTLTGAETLGAPRIGIDDAATAWFRETQWEANRRTIAERKLPPEDPFARHWNRELEDVLKDYAGGTVLHLTGYDRSVIPAATPIATAFCGEVVKTSKILDAELRGLATEDHDATATLAYGRRIEAAVLAHLRGAEPALAELDADGMWSAYRELLQASRDAKPDGGVDEDSSEAAEAWERALPSERRAIVKVVPELAAADWAIYWGEKGHGFQPFF